MIIRAPKDKENPYFIASSGYANDSRLSWAARGMMTYLIDKPDNWKIIVEDLINKSPAGKHATRATLNELIEYGYVVRHQKRDPETHQWGEVYYTVCENPAITPLSDFPQAGEPEAEKPSTENQPLSNTKSKKEIKEREIYELPADLLCLQFYETQVNESIEPFVDQLRGELKRLGEKRVVAKAKACKNGESWQYLLKSLAKLDENEPELEKKSSKVVQVEQWQPSGYAHKDDPAEERRELFALEHFEDDYDDTIDLNATLLLPMNEVSPEIQQAFDRAKHQLSLQFDTGTYMYFMRDMVIMDYCPVSHTITIEAPHERTKEYMRNIRRVISDVLNQAVELVFTLGGREARPPTYEGLKTGQVAACPA